ncbi:hypothetical protein WICPIJ_004309 [Wickerhamomyces pijperi]|uniref:Uncharacterized protein n=1 Tax=Wickerhamomyces pijperi TaxID=599730 RepID=A0A9P8TM63_WICPI|nr:hypothetical protein WICPIJ_004309 [Wickerhamomyces pijperi]
MLYFKEGINLLGTSGTPPSSDQSQVLGVLRLVTESLQSNIITVNSLGVLADFQQTVAQVDVHGRIVLRLYKSVACVSSVVSRALASLNSNVISSSSEVLADLADSKKVLAEDGLPLTKWKTPRLFKISIGMSLRPCDCNSSRDLDRYDNAALMSLVSYTFDKVNKATGSDGSDFNSLFKESKAAEYLSTKSSSTKALKEESNLAKVNKTLAVLLAGLTCKARSQAETAKALSFSLQKFIPIPILASGLNKGLSINTAWNCLKEAL